MPTYEYRCNACGHRFEKLQKFSDDPIRTCPECGEDEAERLISSGAGLVFKGSGFYATDYRNSSGRREGKERAGEAGDGGSSGDAGDGGSGASGAGGAKDAGGATGAGGGRGERDG